VVLVTALGRLGTGKTLILTKLGYIGFKEGKEVYADYHLKFDYTHINTLLDITNIEDTKNKIFLFDECWISADSREFMSKQNILISRFMLQSRKKNFDVISSAQDIGQIERRIRLVNDIILLPEILNREDNNDPKSKPIEIVVEKYHKDVSGNYNFTNKTIYDVRGVCDLYDTSEIIKPMDTQKIYVDEFKKKYKDIIKRYMNDERKMSKKELKTLLILDDNVTNSDAEMLCEYISVKKRG